MCDFFLTLGADFRDDEVMKIVFSILLTPTLAWGQCPSTPSPDFSCTSAGGNTRITLFANAELKWDRFDVPMGGSLDISSVGGGSFASRHLTPGNFPSTIAGGITADGPFALVNSAGISMKNTGSIFAPSILLSTMPVSKNNLQSFQGSTRSGQMLLSGSLRASSGDVTLLGYQMTTGGNIQAPNGKVTVISSGSQVVDGNYQISPPEGERNSRARVSNRGAMIAPVVEIYSEGFLQNNGRIQGQHVTLNAPRGVLHENSPGSMIIADDLSLPNGGLIQGPLLNGTEGNNPGAVSTSLGLPDLKKGTFAGKRKTTLLPTQFSSSNLSSSRVPSAVSRKKATGSSRLATRGSAKKKSSKKRSFFGTVINR